MKKDTPTNSIERPPVVAIMGHVDHGKSSLLDYIRKSNIVAGEAGGITQRISAYEVVHKNSEGDVKKITFIDTPGHAAFSHMRERGASIADIAILIVSGEEGVKAQTVEAIKTILENKVPYIVAISKMDRPNANADRIKSELLEHGVYVEGFGGDIPCLPISAVTGAGVDDLLETILLLAQLQEFTGNPDALASGFVIESHLDEQRGISAILIIKDGTISKGQFVVVDGAMTTTRILEDFLGKPIEGATFSAPIQTVGFSILPNIGSVFQTYDTKKEAESAAAASARNVSPDSAAAAPIAEGTKVIPIIIKSDVFGLAEAIEAEINKISINDILFKITKKGVGSINESDVQLALADKNTIIIGFNVSVERTAKDVSGFDDVTIKTFDIIYKITEWLSVEAERRRPRRDVEQILGRARILKVFSSTKNVTLAGANVLEGSFKTGAQIKITRKDEDIGRGKIESMQSGKSPVQTVEIGTEFGMTIETKAELAGGDIVESFIIANI